MIQVCIKGHWSSLWEDLDQECAWWISLHQMKTMRDMRSQPCRSGIEWTVISTVFIQSIAKSNKYNYLFIQCHKICLIKRQVSSHKYKEDDSTRPDIRRRTIITFVIKHLMEKQNIKLRTMYHPFLQVKDNAYLRCNVIWSSTSSMKQSILLNNCFVS